MRLEGSLDAFSLPDIFSLLSMTKKTGGLHLRRADSHGEVWLRDGLITGGSSDVSSLTLGHRLAGMSQVSDDALAAATDLVRADSSIGLAAALLDAGAVEPEVLHGAVREHILDTVFDLMRWPDGVFQFEADASNTDDIAVAQPVEDVVAEARRRLDIWADIDPAVSAAEAVLARVLDPGQEVTLDVEEWALLGLVDGQRSVRDLVRARGAGEFAVVVALSALVDRSLIAASDGQSHQIDGLAQRQALITSLETGVPSSDVGTADAASVEPAAPVGIESDAEPVAEPIVEPFAEPEEERVELHAVAPVLTLAQEVEDADSSEDDDYNADIDFTAVVTPARPEPFLPARAPEHPEPLVAMTGDGTVPQPMPATLIERDPSVNKSLLLRLIAGVRGL